MWLKVGIWIGFLEGHIERLNTFVCSPSLLISIFFTINKQIHILWYYTMTTEQLGFISNEAILLLI